MQHLWPPTYSEDLTKLAILPDYECPLMLCLVFGLIKKMDFQGESLNLFKSKIIKIFIFFSRKSLGAHIMLKLFFDEATKLCKISEDTYDWTTWLILCKTFLNE